MRLAIVLYSNMDKFRPASRSVLFTTLLVLLVSQSTACFAQQPSQYGGSSARATKTVKEMLSQPAPRIPARTPAENVLFGKPERLNADQVQFPDVPNYTGKAKYQGGMRYEQNDGKGSVLTIATYSVVEPRSQVKEWFLNALRGYGWNVTFQSDTVINAINNKTGNYCNMQFNDARTRTERSTYQIDYHKVNK